MKCKYCGEEMRLDDRDYYRTYTDLYFVCDKCSASCVEKRSKLKGKRTLSVDWQEPWDDEVMK